MWQLRRRSNGENHEWSELGSFDSIADAARCVIEHEDRPGALFFQVYADPLMPKSDADILARLEYRGTNGFYLLTRRMQ